MINTNSDFSFLNKIIMAKNFPYFKFIATDWLTGNIVFESFECQGLFINICALYWQKDGLVSILDLNKRYKSPNLLKKLENEYFKIDENGFVSIDFLDEQLNDAEHISIINSKKGKKSALKRLKNTTDVQPISTDVQPISTDVQQIQSKYKVNTKEIKEKEIKEKLLYRKLKFATSLEIYLFEFGKEILNEFYSYWTEHSENGLKMRFEKQTVFEIKRRLTTWKINKKKFNNGKQIGTKAGQEHPLAKIRGLANAILENDASENSERSDL